MNVLLGATALPEILAILESVTAALERSKRLQARAPELLRARSLDCGDLMIILTSDLDACLMPREA